MLLDFRCGDCGTVAERVVSRSAIPASLRCDCGGDARRVFSAPFAFKSYAVDRSTFFEVAPLDSDGRPMTMREAAKAGAAQAYRRDEKADIRRKQKRDEAQAIARAAKQAKREAWAAQRAHIRTGSSA